MLGKLFKHDFKALSRLLIPTQLAVLASAILGSFGLTFMLRNGFDFSEDWSRLMNFVQPVLGLLIGVMVLAMIAASFLTMFIIFQHFYKNFMCSEGYLTFTLPVTTSQLLWSKLLTAMIWFLISAIVICISVFIFLTFGTATHGLVSSEFIRAFGYVFGTIGQYLTGHVALLAVEILIAIVLAVALEIVHVYLSIILGGVVAKQHKILAAIGFYFAINIGLSILVSLGSALFVANMAPIGGVYVEGVDEVAEVINLVIAAVQPMMLYVLAISALITAGGFVASHYLLRNKLNLE